MGGVTTLQAPVSVSGSVVLEKSFSVLFDPRSFFGRGVGGAIAMCNFGGCSSKFLAIVKESFKDSRIKLLNTKPLNMDFGIFRADNISFGATTKSIIGPDLAMGRSPWMLGSVFDLMALRIVCRDIRCDQPILSPGSFGNMSVSGRETNHFVFPAIFSVTSMVSAGYRMTQMSEPCGNYRLLAVRPSV